MRVEDEKGTKYGVRNRVQGARSEGDDGKRNQASSNNSVHSR